VPRRGPRIKISWSARMTGKSFSMIYILIISYHFLLEIELAFFSTNRFTKSSVAEDDFGFSEISASVDNSDKSDSRSCPVRSPRVIFYQL